MIEKPLNGDTVNRFVKFIVNINLKMLIDKFFLIDLFLAEAVLNVCGYEVRIKIPLDYRYHASLDLQAKV